LGCTVELTVGAPVALRLYTFPPTAGDATRTA
jgi:hypothetical protein